MKIAVLEGDNMYSNCLGFSVSKAVKKTGTAIKSGAKATGSAVKKTADVTTKYAVRKPAQAIIGKKTYAKVTKVERKYNPVKIAARNIASLTDSMKKGAIAAIRKAATPAVRAYIGKNPNLTESGIDSAAQTLSIPVTATALSIATASTGGTAALLAPFINSAVKNELKALIRSMLPKKIVKAVLPVKAKPKPGSMPKGFMAIKPATKAITQPMPPPPIAMPKVEIKWPEEIKKTPEIIPQKQIAEPEKKQINWILPAAAAGAALLFLGAKK